MAKAYKDYSINDVVRLAGYWLHKDAEQMEALAYIYDRMAMLEASTTDAKLLELFGSGDGNNIITDKELINKIIFNYEGVSLTSGDTSELDERDKKMSKDSVKEKIDELNCIKRSMDTKSAELEGISREHSSKRSEIASIISGSAEGALASAVKQVEESSTLRFLRIVGNGIEFIQSTPTVLCDIDLEAGVNLRQDMGRYIVYMPFNSRTGRLGSASDMRVYGGHGFLEIHSHIHPNISRSGACCYGTGNADAALASGRNDWGGLASLVDRLLRTMSTGTPYVDFSNFCKSSTRHSGLSESQQESLGLDAIDNAEVPVSESFAYYWLNGGIVKLHYSAEFQSLLYSQANGRYFTDSDLSLPIDNVVTFEDISIGECFADKFGRKRFKVSNSNALDERLSTYFYDLFSLCVASEFDNPDMSALVNRIASGDSILREEGKTYLAVGDRDRLYIVNDALDSVGRCLSLRSDHIDSRRLSSAEDIHSLVAELVVGEAITDEDYTGLSIRIDRSYTSYFKTINGESEYGRTVDAESHYFSDTWRGSDINGLHELNMIINDEQPVAQESEPVVTEQEQEQQTETDEAISNIDQDIIDLLRGEDSEQS